MQKLHFSIRINAPKKKVWDTMLGDATYREWATPFSEGSHYVGNWGSGSKMLFLGPWEDGKLGGMVSRIRENREYEFVSIEHLGFVADGIEDTTSENVKNWAGAHEDYTFTESNGLSEVQVDIDVAEEYTEMFEDMWPKALAKLKEIAERS